jgi:hypothetical protein
MAQEVEQFVGLATAGAEMDIGDEKRAKAPRDGVRHGAQSLSCCFMSRPHSKIM